MDTTPEPNEDRSANNEQMTAENTQLKFQIF